MDGRDSFTATEVGQIRKLLREKARADRSGQKIIRSQLRKLGFYISDFALNWSSFRTADFNDLLNSGRVKVIE